MKIKNWIKTNWQYLLVFAMPWVFVLIHSLVRSTWPVYGDSILYKDAGTLYINLYSELWDKVHGAGSLIFNWSLGLGVELLVNIFTYLMSPFSLIVLVAPKELLADMVQVIMVLKWSLLSVTMLYYVLHTRHNSLQQRKELLSIVLSMAYFFSNMVINTLHSLSMLDSMILVPILLLLVERVVEGKNIRAFYIVFAISIIVNYRLAIPIAIFVLGWFALQFTHTASLNKKCVVSFLMTYVAAIMTSALVLVPGLLSVVGVSDGNFSSVMSLSDFLQRFFVCDSLWFAQAEQPMLYCSVVMALLALSYLFTDVQLEKKIGTGVLLVLLCLGLVTETGNIIWNGNRSGSAEYGFLVIFLLVFMAMETMVHMASIKIWQCFVVGVVGIAGIVYGFFNARLLLDFYVYLGTFLITVFIVLMLIFYCKKSIQYKNVLIVFAVVCIGELAVNAYYQLEMYNQYAYEDMYFHKNADNLSMNLQLDQGEKVAATQVMYNYGMTLQLPIVSQEHAVSGNEIGELYKSLGMEWSEAGSSYCGGSPLLNTMFNVQYGMSQDEMAFSDCELLKSTDTYNLYQMNRLAGLGYMVENEVTDWNIDSVSPFEAQNEFVKKATGRNPIFEILTPEVSCVSLTGVDPTPEADHHGHNHEEGEVCEYDAEAVYHGEYIEDSMYYYQFYKMYSEDMVTFTFESDGVSDYYIYVKGAHPSNTYVQVNDEYVYWDQFASNQKTLHIGVVPKGQTISVISNFEVDDIAWSEIRYQVAAFKEEQYSAVYDALSANTLHINSFDDCIEGEITADKDGIMLTSIAANKGISVLVDGNTVEWKRIGKALVGVPLSKGTHTVVIEYHVPYLVEGVLLSLLGIVIFVVFYIVWLRNKKKEEVLG